MNLNIKQRIRMIDKFILKINPKPTRSYLITYDRGLNPTKYFVDGKEFTEEELDKYLEQFEKTEGMTIFTPVKMIHLTREPKD